MLQRLDPKVAACLKKATEARQRAAAAPDPEQRAYHLRMEKSWTRVAESMAAGDRRNAYFRDQVRHHTEMCLACDGALRMKWARRDREVEQHIYECTECGLERRVTLREQSHGEASLGRE
jgi:hypothetical protein